MIFRNDNGVDYCQFEHLSAHGDVGHAIFLRSQGASESPFDRLNVSLAVGDAVDRVERNRRQVAAALNATELAFARQVHGDSVWIIGDRRVGDGGGVPEADILITDRAEKFLVVQVADCQPILVYDPTRRVVANGHCGWRGSVADVPGRMVEALSTNFGCAAQDLLVGIGPSLGPCCAEMVNFQAEIPRAYWGYRRDTAFFDFWSMTRDQLVGAGVRDDHIEFSGLCTRCHSDRFFSYRRQQRTGRFPAVIGLKT